MMVVADRLSLRWYRGYDLGEHLPDHSSLTRIRERYGVETFRRFFDHIVQLCADAGLVWGEELFFDATKVRANAAMASVRFCCVVLGYAVWPSTRTAFHRHQRDIRTGEGPGFRTCHRPLPPAARGFAHPSTTQ